MATKRRNPALHRTDLNVTSPFQERPTDGDLNMGKRQNQYSLTDELRCKQFDGGPQSPSTRRIRPKRILWFACAAGVLLMSGSLLAQEVEQSATEEKQDQAE